MRRTSTLLGAFALGALALTGCGGGGGGGNGGPGGVRPGTVRATGSGVDNLSSNVTGASADARTVRLYGDQRTGPTNAYTSSRRLSIVLYRPVQPGSYPVATSGASGTSGATFTVTRLVSGKYVVDGNWQATSGSVTVTKVDNVHLEGSFELTLRNPANGNVITYQDGAFNVSYETPPPPTG